MMPVIKLGTELDENDFDELIDLDIRFYGNEIITDAGEAKKRFLANRDSIVAAYSEDVLVGFLCYLNVKSDIVKRVFEQDEYLDDNVPASSILPFSKEKKNDIFFLDIVVEERFRGTGVSRLLMDEWKKHLCSMALQGYAIGKFFGFVLTEGGMRLVNNIHGTIIRDDGEHILFTLCPDKFLELPSYDNN